MKKPRLSFIWGIIMFLLMAGIYAGGYLFYTDYTQKVNYFISQNQYIAKKNSGLQSNLRKLENVLENLKTANTRQQKRILAEVDKITGEIQEWKNEYDASLEEMKQGYSASIDKLQISIEELQKIDLGKISVEKDIKEKVLRD